VGAKKTGKNNSVAEGQVFKQDPAGSADVKRGDTVALMLVNRPEFNIADCGAMHLGAIAFSVYNTCTPEQVEFLFGNAGNRVVITERQFLPVVLEAKKRSPALEHVVLVDGQEGAISLARLEEMGQA
jgi:long-subunit acyl-CoA synthetase (AMP-forming)